MLNRLLKSMLVLITVTSPLAAQLEIHNNRWFRDRESGRTLWLYGHGVTNLISQTGLDIAEHNSHYASYGANTQRLHLTQGALGEGAPWKLLPDGRYDLSAWNERWWERLHLYMADCKARGIYPFLQIWDEPVIERGETRWRVNPWRPSNNVNSLAGLADDPAGHGMPGFYDVNDEKLMELQKAFVRRVLDATAQYGICIYSFCNEYDYGAKAPVAWQNYWVEFFRGYERSHPDLPAPLLYTNTAVRRYMDDGCRWFPVIDWYYLGRDFRMKSFGRYGEDLSGTGARTLRSMVERAGELYPDKPLINSRPASSPDRGTKDFTNEEETRRIAWTFFTSAVHLSGYRHLNPAGPDDKTPWLRTHPECVECTDGLAMERSLESVHTFIRLAEPGLAELTPAFDSAAGTPVFRLRSDREQVIYLPEGGAAEVNVSSCCDEVYRYDPQSPRDGLKRQERSFGSGGWLEAGNRETVFYVRRKTAPGSGL
ncbi:MAG: hypothetical protein FVQ81_00645 [Candidatus Glassbacteria bacterium]|nr:hypothetical protein [Candidatus Glassbacteria bacterium]